MYGGHHCLFCGSYMTTKGVCSDCQKDSDKKEAELKIMMEIDCKRVQDKEYLVKQVHFENSLYDYFWDQALEEAAKIAESKDSALADQIKALRKYR